jgi:predicted nucleotidyltransferase
MRLSNLEIDTIKKEISLHLEGAEIYLFGSRLDNSKKGGDIDILVKVSQKPSLELQSKIYWNICEVIGEQKIDIIYNDGKEENSFIKMISAEMQKI